MKLNDIEVSRALETPVAPALNETQKILAKALELLGPNGEMSNFGSYEYREDDGRMCVGCAVATAMNLQGNRDREATYSTALYSPAGHALTDAAQEMGAELFSYVSRDAKSFGPVRAMILRAIELAA